MRCERYLERLDGLDAGERPDAAMRRHTARCETCSAATLRYESALLAYREERAGLYSGDERLDGRVMATVRLLPPPQQDVALRDWILVGSIIALSMLLIPFGREFSFLKEAFGARYALPLSLVLGTVLTAYMTLFIGTHMEVVQGFLDERLKPR